MPFCQYHGSMCIDVVKNVLCMVAVVQKWKSDRLCAVKKLGKKTDLSANKWCDGESSRLAVILYYLYANLQAAEDLAVFKPFHKRHEPYIFL